MVNQLLKRGPDGGGKIFYGCSGYPNWEVSFWDVSQLENCVLNDADQCFLKARERLKLNALTKIVVM